MKTLLIGTLLLLAEGEDLMTIHGQRPESGRLERGGQSLVIQPGDEATRYESITHLKRESSVLLPETGRISASGFVVPCIRGQDVKLSDVYLEDIKLQDPYSGLPLIEDLDLRAFGSMEIHQGLPPPELPGSNPIGTIRYRFRQEPESNLRLGVQTGSPYGWSGWGLGIHRGESSDARIYAREHRTSGRYAYYSDEGTPYNTADDKTRSRENNDQLSLQAVPYYRKTWGDYTLQTLGWVYKADRGLPSTSRVVESTARETVDGHIAHIGLRRDFEESSLFLAGFYHLSLGQRRDDRKITDPTNSSFGGAASTDLDMKSQSMQAQIGLRSELWDGVLMAEENRSFVNNRADARRISDLERRHRTLALGTRLLPMESVALESKAGWIRLKDQDQGRTDNAFQADEWNQRDSSRDARSLGLSLAYLKKDWALYSQWAEAQRLPSLLEEFGNGSSIRPNVSLKAEDLDHYEMGFSLTGSQWSLGGAAYRDLTKNRIIFVPIAATASKAQNVRETDVRGVDLRAHYQWRATSFYLSTSRLYPYDKTRDEKKILPGIPERVVIFEATQSLGEAWVLRWFARYRSEVYRDLGNSVQLPGAWIHDVSGDYKLRSDSGSWSFGLALRNVFDVRDLLIEAPNTAGNKGRTAYSDIAGYPLPGRQWTASLTYALRKGNH